MQRLMKTKSENKKKDKHKTQWVRHNLQWYNNKYSIKILSKTNGMQASPLGGER